MDETPICKKYTFKFLPKKYKPLLDWQPGFVLENIHWFGLKNILENFPFGQACKIINKIKKHFYNKN